MPSIPIALQSYDRGFESLSIERLVNCAVEAAPQSATSPLPVIGTPGMVTEATVGDGPIRGAQRWRGANYIVSGGEVWRFSDAFGSIKVGDVPGDGNVSMGALASGVVMVVGGQYSYTAGTTLVTPTLPAWSGFDVTPESVTVINNTAIIGFAGSDFYAWSAPNDAADFNAIDVARAERKTDITVRIYSDNNELLLFGERSLEIKYDSAVATGRWKSIGNGVVERGCAAFGSIATMDNTTLWLGDDLVVYRLNGRTPQRISTHWLEYQMQEMDRVDDAYAYGHTWNGHKLYTISFPFEQKSFVIDLNTGLPHERRSWGRPHYRGSVAFTGEGQAPLIGDAFDGTISSLSNTVFTEAGSIIERVIISPYVHTDDGDPFSVDELSIVMDTGRAPAGTAEADLMMRYTDDGLTWSSERTASVGAVGRYGNRVRFHQLGQTETGFRAFEYRMTADLPFRIVKSRAKIDVGQT